MTKLTALPPHRHPWETLAAREDLRWVDGMLHLVHDDQTPDAARTADLTLIADALEAAGVEPLLIRHGRSRPALVVTDAQAPVAIDAISALGHSEPLYVKTRNDDPRLASDSAWPDAAPASVRLFRPRVTPGGSLRYGLRESVTVEIWRFDDGTVHAPRANALTRRVFPVSELEKTTVTRYGRSWHTLSGMFDPQPDEFIGEIDMVFSWVDGSSSEFQRQRAARMEEYVVGAGDDGPARYRHVDELRYALRSVHLYAPWVRRIFIATDSTPPAWLKEHPKVTIVRSEEFFADPAVLPTHNSHAVESQLHHIDGLSEHFLYSNDDMFFGRAVQPELFFSAGGVSRFVECGIRIGSGGAHVHRSGHDNALRVNRELLRERFGRTILRDLEHCAAPLRRSVLYELEETFSADFARTAASRFRSATDVSVTNCLYHYYALATGRAVTTTMPKVRYVQTTMASSLRRMENLVERRDADMFCLNDGGENEVPESVRVQRVTDVLERMFPVRAPWEIDEVSAAPASEQASAQR
ncbi:stealth family protein [Microbacterium sp.]|uniref:stealth family protein n=1 Tax=Microbacterium sp. TaxID=51671 RepID=UPI0039E5A78A